MAAFRLLVLGLAISVPLIVAGAALIMALLTRLPALVWAGAGLLGWIAGEVMATDPAVQPALHAFFNGPVGDRPRWTPQIVRHGAAVRQWRAWRRGGPWNPRHHRRARRRLDLAQAQAAGRRALRDGVGTSAPQRRQSPAAPMAPSAWGRSYLGLCKPGDDSQRSIAAADSVETAVSSRRSRSCPGGRPAAFSRAPTCNLLEPLLKRLRRAAAIALFLHGRSPCWP